MNAVGYLLVLLFTLGNALEYLLMKASSLNVYAAGMIMFATAGSLLAVVIFLRRNKRPSHFHIPIKKALIIGVISFLINMLWLKGLDYTTATNASILGKTDVAFSLLLSWIILNERIYKKTLLFIAAMIIGIFFVMEVKLSDLSSLNIGDILVILSAALLAFNAFRIRTILHTSGSFEIAAINCLMNVIGFLLMFLLSGAYALPSAAEPVGFSFLAGFFCFLFFCGYYPSLRVFSLWKVRVLALLTPIFTVLGELLFLSENLTLTLMQIAGILLVLAGIYGIIFYEKVRNDRKQAAQSGDSS